MGADQVGDRVGARCSARTSNDRTRRARSSTEPPWRPAGRPQAAPSAGVEVHSGHLLAGRRDASVDVACAAARRHESSTRTDRIRANSLGESDVVRSVTCVMSGRSGSSARCRRLRPWSAGRGTGPRRRPGRPNRPMPRPAGSPVAPARTGSARSPRRVAHGVGPGPGRTVSAVASRTVQRGAAGAPGGDDAGGGQPAVPDHARSPSRRRGRAGPPTSSAIRVSAVQPLHPDRWPAAARPAGPAPRPPPRSAGRPASASMRASSRVDQRPRIAGDARSGTARRRLPRTRRGRSGARTAPAQRPSSASAQAGDGVRGPTARGVHWRSGTAS